MQYPLTNITFVSGGGVDFGFAHSDVDEPDYLCLEKSSVYRLLRKLIHEKHRGIRSYVFLVLFLFPLSLFLFLFSRSLSLSLFSVSFSSLLVVDRPGTCTVAHLHVIVTSSFVDGYLSLWQRRGQQPLQTDTHRESR
jgi:hypothetical protein